MKLLHSATNVYTKTDINYRYMSYYWCKE